MPELKKRIIDFVELLDKHYELEDLYDRLAEYVKDFDSEQAAAMHILKDYVDEDELYELEKAETLGVVAPEEPEIECKILWDNGADKERGKRDCIGDVLKLWALNKYEGDIDWIHFLDREFLSMFKRDDYIVLQGCWGGPSCEFRFYDDHIEYVFLDWYTGIGFDVTQYDWLWFVGDYIDSLQLDMVE